MSVKREFLSTLFIYNAINGREIDILFDNAVLLNKNTKPHILIKTIVSNALCRQGLLPIQSDYRLFQLKNASHT